jgi:hypothetical protein
VVLFSDVGDDWGSSETARFMVVIKEYNEKDESVVAERICIVQKWFESIYRRCGFEIQDS